MKGIDYISINNNNNNNNNSKKDDNNTVTEAHVSYNKLKTLKHLAIFPNLITIDANHNEIKYICSSCDEFDDHIHSSTTKNNNNNNNSNNNVDKTNTNVSENTSNVTFKFSVTIIF